MPEIPLWLKIGYAVFLCVLIPVYYKKYGPANFLWFSDVALFGTGIGLWLENSLIISVIAVTALLPEVAWNIDYFWRLLTGKKLLGQSDYMFDKKKSRFLRGLSLFHVVLPAVIIYLLYQLGYQHNAIYYQLLFAWMLLLSTYFFTKSEDNINLVFGPGTKPQEVMPPGFYLISVLILYPLLIFLPTHFLLKWLF